MIYPIILSGGSGTRLWPLSRKSYPKQFTALMGEESLFQASAQRLSGEDFFSPVIVTGEPFRFIVTEQLAQIEQSPQGILIEPEGRNTAPAVLAAALWVAERDPKGMMLVAPSDHVISDTEAFQSTVKAAVPCAHAGNLVTFGITPTRAETGYGYLELESGSYPTAKVPQTLARFVEKPDVSQAEKMLAEGIFLWNAGIYLFTAEAILAAYQRYAPSLVEAVMPAMDSASQSWKKQTIWLSCLLQKAGPILEVGMRYGLKVALMRKAMFAPPEPLQSTAMTLCCGLTVRGSNWWALA